MSVETATAIVEHLGRQHEAMIALLADLVNIDSGSYNKRGVDAVGARLREFLEPSGLAIELFPNPTYGACIAARLPGGGAGNLPPGKIIPPRQPSPSPAAVRQRQAAPRPRPLPSCRSHGPPAATGR